MSTCVTSVTICPSTHTIHNVFLEYTILPNKMSLVNVRKIYKAIEHVAEMY